LDAKNALGRSTGALSRSLNTWKVGRGIPSASVTGTAYKLAYDSSVKLYSSVHAENGSRIPNLDTRLKNLLKDFANKP
jgi:hypothetical protein